jgi:uncharacterized membrane protein YeaQ/YmgE (transglycosylase-associated protein family)
MFKHGIEQAASQTNAAGVAKLHLFAGLSVEDASRVLGISRATAFRHWTYARAWLQTRLQEIVGAIVGGFLGTLLGFGDVSGFDLRSMLLAVAGGLVVLFVYGLATKKRVS